MPTRLINYEGFSNINESEKRSYFYHKPIFILMVCPHCGEEIYAMWDFHQIKDINRKDIIEKYDYMNVQKKITYEIEEFLTPENFKCEFCGKSLNYEPGFYHFHDCGFFKYNKRPQIFNLIDTKINDFFNTFNEQQIKEIKENKYTNIEKNIYGFLRPVYLGSSEKFADSASIENAFSLLAEFRQDTSNIKHANRIKELTKHTLNDVSQVNISTKKEDVEFLKEYFKNLIQVETDLQIITKRLPILYSTQEANKIKKNNKLIFKEERQELLMLKKRMKKVADEIESYQPSYDWKKYYDQIMATKEKIKYPIEPTKPAEPTLEKPGLFNKKKVEEKNNQLLCEYEKSLTLWKSKMNDVVKETERLKTIEIQTKNDAEKEAKEKVKLETEKNIKKKKETLEKLQVKYDSLNKDLEKKLELVSNMSEDYWDIEVQQAESALKKCIEIKSIYESIDLVFFKYRNIIAYSSFYEYLVAGRCNTLEGRDGAYNLYESELRQNMIISQLSTVITSLESIKNNQNYLYLKVTEMNDNLNELNGLMKAAVSALNSIEEKTDIISLNMEKVVSNTDVIAYNTAATAYYSRLNVELTNALGFMLALK